MDRWIAFGLIAIGAVFVCGATSFADPETLPQLWRSVRLVTLGLTLEMIGVMVLAGTRKP